MTTKTKTHRGNRFHRSWTKDSVLEAINRWHQKIGRPPVGADWNPARARFLAAGHKKRYDDWMKRIKEYEQGNYPSYTTVQDLFDGKWNDAIKTAGFVPLPCGRMSKQQATLWAKVNRHKKQVDDTSAILSLQYEEVQKAIKSSDDRELRMALLDLASVAATWAEELAKDQS